jgi:transposase
MIGMEMIAMIKRLQDQGMSVRQISRKTGYSRNTIGKYLKGGQPVYQRQKEDPSPMKERIRPMIEQWLEEDRLAPKKQRRTRLKMFNDLVAQYDYAGSYTTVKKVVQEIVGSRKEVFVPRHYEPGEFIEFDFGEFEMEVGGVRQKAYLHAYQLPLSNDRFGYVSFRQTQDEMFESHRRAFEHFGGVSKVVRYDNLKQAVTHVLKGRFRKENTHFTKFRLQLGYEAEFCEPGKGNQKGDVEGCVGFLRRNFLSPVPKLKREEDIEVFNEKLALDCKTLRSRIVSGTTQTVGEWLVLEQTHLQPLPYTDSNNLGRQVIAKANHYSMICVDGVFYSVPTAYAHRVVDVVISARKISVYAKDKLVATHERSFQKGQQIFDPTHYMAVFKKKPYTLLNGKPIQGLPHLFSHFFSRAYQRGTLSQCVDILALLRSHSLKDIMQAIELSMAYETYHAEGVSNILAQFKTAQPMVQKLTMFKRPELSKVKIPSVDLSRYDGLVTQKGPSL